MVHMINPILKVHMINRMLLSWSLHMKFMKLANGSLTTRIRSRFCISFLVNQKRPLMEKTLNFMQGRHTQNSLRKLAISSKYVYIHSREIKLAISGNGKSPDRRHHGPELT